jgi:hypothetical protein
MLLPYLLATRYFQPGKSYHAQSWSSFRRRQALYYTCAPCFTNTTDFTSIPFCSASSLESLTFAANSCKTWLIYIEQNAPLLTPERSFSTMRQSFRQPVTQVTN